MARKYGGILGTLAMAVVLVRGTKDAASAASLVWTGVGMVMAFAATGVVLGWMADALVVESVRGQLEAELHAKATTEPNGAKAPSSP
jgi:hypothetical protein